MANKTEIGKAYVQIVPSARGIKGSISNVLSGESDAAGASAGKKIGSGMGAAIKGAIAAAGIGTAISAAMSEGANLEQSKGGIETLFKDNADTVKKYADEAYKTAGLSANAYMENVTSFSASLLSSLGGDTGKAAEAANTAIIDMADNANKMGTSMESIQNAYQGFAKQNYTMLDNLKLGYGGTKSEMERLLADAEKFSGVKYDINNLNDVYSAIHVIQGELDITGTTAKEASSTLAGSMAAVKSAFTNILGKIAIGDDISGAVQGLGSAATDAVKNIINAIVNILTIIPQLLSTMIPSLIPAMVSGAKQLVQGLIEGFSSAMPGINSAGMQIPQEILTAISTELPAMLNSGVDILTNVINGMLESLPNMISSAGVILQQLLIAIMDALPGMAEAGFNLIAKLADGLIQNIPGILTAIATVLMDLIKAIALKAPDLIKSGFELIGKLVAGIVSSIPDVLAGIAEVIQNIIAKFQETDWLEVGKNILKGIADGIRNAIGYIVDAAKDASEKLLNKFKGIFEINSPSKLMANEVGRFIPAGIAEGIDANTDVIKFDKIGNHIRKNAQAAVRSNVIPIQAARGYIDYTRMGIEMAHAMEGVAVRMDGKVVGYITTKHVNKKMADQEELERRKAE